MHYRWDFFISHAALDKESAEALIHDQSELSIVSKRG